VCDRGTPPTLGDIIRQQRELAELPMRQLAAMAGISGPCLPRIERGLRAPSEHVLGAIAKSLETSAEALQDQRRAGAAGGAGGGGYGDPAGSGSDRPATADADRGLHGADRGHIARRRRGRAHDDAGPGTEDGSGPGGA
jgi:hypothetical protein